MRVFNSIQITAIFVAFPFLISYLQDATFRGAGAAFYAACGAYIFGFWTITAAVYEQLRKS